MFRSLRTTIEYTPTCFKYTLFPRVKENQGKGWIPHILNSQSPLHISDGRKKHKFALELGKGWCYIEFVNPRIFPAYVRINGRPQTLKQGENVYIKQNGRTIVISRLRNTKQQNYYITVRAD